jgi:hypothetical protein
MLLLWLVSTSAAGLVDSAVCGEATIPNSNRGTVHPCIGSTGDRCAYACNDGFIAVGEQACQAWTNNTFFGGRCDKLCDPKKAVCPAGTVAIRSNSTDVDNKPCLETVCLPVDDALRNVARGNYELWLATRNNATGVYMDHITLPTLAVPYTQACTEVTGLGVLFESVADAMQWAPRAEIQQRVIQSLQALSGHGPPSFKIPRTPRGWFPTFFDSNTGHVDNFKTGALMSTGLMVGTTVCTTISTAYSTIHTHTGTTVSTTYSIIHTHTHTLSSSSTLPSAHHFPQAAGVMFTKTYFERNDPGSTATKQISELAAGLWRSVDWAHMLCNGTRLMPTATGV